MFSNQLRFFNWVFVALLSLTVAIGQTRTPINRGVLQSDLDANGHLINNLAAPSGANDAARKAYVDSAVSGLSFGSDGQLIFNQIGTLTGSANLKLDYTNWRLGIRSAVPTHTLTIGNAGNGIAVYRTDDQSTNYARLLVGTQA